uniref:Uncharacterized protein n=1 Tax=Ixodes ricinus TaxID=34613 RepID=A0A6B0TYW6_IXORI
MTSVFSSRVGTFLFCLGSSIFQQCRTKWNRYCMQKEPVAGRDKQQKKTKVLRKQQGGERRRLSVQPVAHDTKQPPPLAPCTIECR